ncbi:PEP-CTERM sorting domain-containing protein [Bythopirellula polymerisocia]|nr:PEP-CTERM sorting domain-containing protein [Bythopirellula polymerisocia]
MMKTARLSAKKMTRFTLILALSIVSQDCWAVFVYFDGSTNTDFNLATNWTPENAPGSNLVDIYGIDDGLSSTYSGGTTQVKGLRVGSAAKEHQFGDTHFGRLTMSGGTLEITGSGAEGLFGIGREREPIITDDAKKGGELIMNGSSTIIANGLIVGERTKGLLSIGQNSIVEMRTWDTTVVPNQFGGTEDIRIGNYGPAYDDFGAEPGLDGRGLVDVHGSFMAKDMYFSEHGAQGELRLSGGTVNLNGGLIMDLCDNCQSNPVLLAQRLAKVSIFGSSGTFNVGVDPDPLVVDPMPPLRDILAASPTAVFSFTADSGGVTPITLFQNASEPSGGAEIQGAQLELNLDAFPFTPTSKLTLIDATASLLLGQFGSVTFLGNTTASVNYDFTNGDVFLNNFQSTGGLAGDFDNDGDVDGHDFLVWQRGNSTTPLSPTDLAAWQNDYGTPLNATLASVPEPSAGFLAMIASGVMGWYSQRRKR